MKAAPLLELLTAHLGAAIAGIAASWLRVSDVLAN